jgi:hypothetical protein
MGSWKVTNNAGVPVHVTISTLDVVQYYHNDLAGGGGTYEFDLTDGIWHALTVIPSNGTNQVPDDVNAWKITEIVVGSLGALLAVAAAPFTGGSSVAIAMTIGGAVLAAGDTIASVANFAMNPTTVSSCYGPDDYNFTVSGGEVTGHKGPDGWVITDYAPISTFWHNDTQQTGGTVVADS